MTKTMLITRPKYDDETSYLHAWSSKVIKFAEKNNFVVFDLNLEKASRKEVEGRLSKHAPNLVFFNGHGDPKTIYGHDDQPVIIQEVNHSILKSLIVYSVACESTKQLGHKCIDSGTTSFIGYKEKFVFFTDKNRLATPLNDKLAEPFFEASNEVPISLIKGKNTLKASENSKKIFRKWIHHFIKSKEIEAPFMLSALIDDFMFQEVLGSKTAAL